MNARHHVSSRIALAGATALLFSAAAALNAEPQTPPKKAGPVTVQLFADRSTIAPGETFELAVSVKPDAGHYVYWQNPGGETGLPTEVEWKLPPGFSVGRTRYPVPEKHYDPVLKETNFVYERQAVLLTPVKAPADAKVGSEARFQARVRWLVCTKGQCVPGDAELTLSLPVGATAAKDASANEDVFRKARNALPLPAAKAERVKVSAATTAGEVKPGDQLTVVVKAEIAAGHHMQSHQPYQDSLIPAVVFVELTPGLEIGEVKYPKPHDREDKTLGKLSEYSGTVEFRIPVEVSEEADSSPKWVRGVLQYQICSDSGVCLRPQHIGFAVPLRMAGGPAATEEVWVGGGSAAGGSAAPADEPLEVAADSAPNLFIRAQNWLIGLGFAGVVAAGILGGFLLNFMPCVLPVISIKVLSFVRQAQEDRKRIFWLSLTYSAGIMSFYVVLASLYFSVGTGWGELFQNPVFVIGMAAVVLAFALSLFGVFALFAPAVVNKLGEKAEGEGYPSAFFTGVLATLLGTACTAPFLSAAIAYASQLHPVQGTAIFLAVGFGMAFPFVLLGANPAWVRFIPKPGPWFGAFEAAMGFLLLGTVVWLLNPLRGQIGDYGLLLSLIFLLAVAAAAWIKGRIEFGAPTARKVRLYGLALVVLLVGWLFPFRWMSTIPKLTADRVRAEELHADGLLLNSLLGDPELGPQVGGLLVPRVDWSAAEGIPWQPYRRARAMLAVRSGYTVFVDYTADWCASCKTNLKTSIDRAETIQVMRELNVIPFEADYTLKRPEITEDLRRFQRAGVPLYLVYKPFDTDNPEKLPEILTPSMVIDALRRAGPSRPTAAATLDPSAKTAAAEQPTGGPDRD